MEWWTAIITFVKDWGALAAALGMLAAFLKSIGAIRDGYLCLLRTEITRLYYRHLEDKKLRQYEFENLVKCYEAYTRSGGNSFVKRIFDEMMEWDVVQ